MEIWYEVSERNEWKITPIEVEKAMDTYVFVSGGRRRAKITSYDRLFPTMEKAKAYLIKRTDEQYLVYGKKGK